jgi:hypothetical protein
LYGSSRLPFVGRPPQMYGDDLPFTGIGSGILTVSAVVVTAVGAVLAFAAGPVAAFLGGAAAFATRFVNRNADLDDVT